MVTKDELARSGSAVIEHIWAPPDRIPMTILQFFPLGAATVWSDEEFTAAIPATREQTDQLADLMEKGNETRDFTEYFNLRDRLCGKLAWNALSMKFHNSMQKMMEREEAIRALASAARFN